MRGNYELALGFPGRGMLRYEGESTDEDEHYEHYEHVTFTDAQPDNWIDQTLHEQAQDEAEAAYRVRRDDEAVFNAGFFFTDPLNPGDTYPHLATHLMTALGQSLLDANTLCGLELISNREELSEFIEQKGASVLLVVFMDAARYDGGFLRDLADRLGERLFIVVGELHGRPVEFDSLRQSAMSLITPHHGTVEYERYADGVWSTIYVKPLSRQFTEKVDEWLSHVSTY